MNAIPLQAPALFELQTWMAALVRAPTRLDDPGERAAFDAIISRAGAIEPLRGFAAHSNGYPARIREALADVFEACAHLVGDGDFTALVLRYVAADPPCSYNLNHAGATLPLLLRRDPLAERFAFLSDLAELEWRVAEAFHAAAETPFDTTTVADWGEDEWEQAVIRLQQAAAVVSSPWPIRDLWNARKTPAAEIDVALDGRPQHVLVRRHDLTVLVEEIAADEATALRLVLERWPLGEVTTALAAAGVDETAVGNGFARWASLGLVVGCEPATGVAEHA